MAETNSNPPPPTLQWSAQLAVSQAHRLPGDKINLPASALEGLLSAAARATFEARASQTYTTDNPYSRVTQQRGGIDDDQKNALPHPLTFRLVNSKTGRAIYAGIREFSAEEGEVALSPFLWHALGLGLEADAQEARQGGGDTQMDDNEMMNDVEKAGTSIVIHLRELPKGTFVKLRPLEAGYDPDDWKALLEHHLRNNYTTLTTGEILVVPGGTGANRLGGKDEEFRFLIDGFKPEGAEAVCIVDTDMEVDIEALNEEQARETLKRIAAKMATAPGTEQGSSTGGDIDLFNVTQGQVLPGEYVDYTLPSWPRAQPIELELEGVDEDDDVDLLVSPLSARQRVRPRLDEHVFADFGQSSRPFKRIRLEPTNIELEDAEALWISVYAFSPTPALLEPSSDGAVTSPALRHYTLRVRSVDPKSSTTADIPEPDSVNNVPPNEGDVRCKNCTQWVPQRTLMLHENFCLRNNVLCPKGCGQVFQKRSEAYASHWHCPHDAAYGNTTISHAKHDSLMHPTTPLTCPGCSGTTTQTPPENFPTITLLAHHRTTTCPSKLHLCRFCHLLVPQSCDPATGLPSPEAVLSGLSDHELLDGARTTECRLCARRVRLRDLDTHLRLHDSERKVRVRPRLCRNALCGRTRGAAKTGQGTEADPGDEIGLCNACFGPLYVSLYDPERKALKRRIERRYLTQLTRGCGKTWCRNPMCATGRKTLEVTPAALSMKDAMALSKPEVDASVLDSVDAAADTESETGGVTGVHFCVDEASQVRRTLAEMLSSEGKGDAVAAAQGRGYGLTWCVAALEAGAGDLERARQWLRDWAPTRDEEKGGSR